MDNVMQPCVMEVLSYFGDSLFAELELPISGNIDIDFSKTRFFIQAPVYAWENTPAKDAEGNDIIRYMPFGDGLDGSAKLSCVQKDGKISFERLDGDYGVNRLRIYDIKPGKLDNTYRLNPTARLDIASLKIGSINPDWKEGDEVEVTIGKLLRFKVADQERAKLIIELPKLDSLKAAYVYHDLQDGKEYLAIPHVVGETITHFTTLVMDHYSWTTQ